VTVATHLLAKLAKIQKSDTVKVIQANWDTYFHLISSKSSLSGFYECKGRYKCNNEIHSTHVG
jgi:hypothetical protein